MIIPYHIHVIIIHCHDVNICGYWSIITIDHIEIYDMVYFFTFESATTSDQRQRLNHPLYFVQYDLKSKDHFAFAPLI